MGQHGYSQGALRVSEGGFLWRLWAPNAETVQLVISPGPQEVVRDLTTCGEMLTCQLDDAAEGLRYCYRVDGVDLPDPASRSQPDGVHRASVVVDVSQFHWSDHQWTGIPREQLILYELHVGTFTSEGTFGAIIPRLAELKALGITAIELMPVSQFPGTRNWGYDGVFPFAVQHSYGGPRELQRLVDAAHRVGLGVILDVVYNHLGPEGNYLSRFGPYFTDKYHTPWGKALNFDDTGSEPVRRFIIDNARMWVRDFHMDGLRLDAIHAIYDLGARHILTELQKEVQDIADQQGRIVHLIGESNQNDPRIIDPVERNGIGLNAVWADDFHHSVHALLRGERHGYFADFGQPEQLAKAYNDVFVYDGIDSQCKKRRHGASVRDRDRTQFVVCVHNHDQIGNRAQGDRPSTWLSQEVQRLTCGLLLISPCIPMLFMGEEYGEQNPFPFFCSFEDSELIEVVRKGRRQEFEDLGFQWGEEISDPQAESTFISARLTWAWPPGTFAAQMRQLYVDMLALRRTHPGLLDRQHTRAEIIPVKVGNPPRDSPVLSAQRGVGKSLLALANLSGESVPRPGLPVPSELILSTELARYGGRRSERSPSEGLLPWEMQLYECHESS
ncbi:malto-oligosyltrehalose trehalohydrolase [Planctomicrobium sp. SH661]|uniref:malto-oligosyltrehalose trehalohydrolase n=1 Tax=Planctomicrobium sp. SH661 TaxID=3448124 RepID=UPI003F5C94DF